jgi:hypothetical protein
MAWWFPMNIQTFTKPLCAALIGLLVISPGVAAVDYVLPTAIPSDPAEQLALRKSLSAKASGARTLQEWKQLAVLYVSYAGDSPPTDAAALAEAEQLVLAARQQLPNDAELMALEGSLTCMKARGPNVDGALAMTYSRQGFRQLDKAVVSDPENLGARLQRGITLLHVPKFLDKTAVAQGDLEFVLDHVPARSDGSILELRAMLYYLLGDAFAAADQAPRARQSWEQAAALKQSVWSAKARAKLSPP